VIFPVGFYVIIKCRNSLCGKCLSENFMKVHMLNAEKKEVILVFLAIVCPHTGEVLYSETETTTLLAFSMNIITVDCGQ
jgi:hypothetical protein